MEIEGHWRVKPAHPNKPYLGTGGVGYSKTKTPVCGPRVFVILRYFEYQHSNRIKSIHFFGGRLTHARLCLFGKLFFPFVNFPLALLQVFLALC